MPRAARTRSACSSTSSGRRRAFRRRWLLKLPRSSRRETLLLSDSVLPVVRSVTNHDRGRTEGTRSTTGVVQFLDPDRRRAEGDPAMSLTSRGAAARPHCRGRAVRRRPRPRRRPTMPAPARMAASTPRPDCYRTALAGRTPQRNRCRRRSYPTSIRSRQYTRRRSERECGSVSQSACQWRCVLELLLVWRSLFEWESKYEWKSK